MGSVRRHPNAQNRWQARYRDPDGKQRTKNFDRKVDAERFLTMLEADKLTGDWIDPKLARTNFGSWANQWLATKVNLKPKTRVGYESLLRRHVIPKLGELRLEQIRPLLVREWVAQLDASGLSASRIRQIYQLTSSILKSAVEAGYIGRSPCVGIDLPKTPPREMRFCSGEEVRRLSDAIQEPYGTLVLLLAYGGLRWGEAVALRRHRCQLLRSRVEIVESLSEAGGQLHFGPTKNWKNREIVLPAFLSDRLAAHLAEHVPESDGLVFTTRGHASRAHDSNAGFALRHANFRKRVWIPATDQAGLQGLRMHDLRHTAVALSIAEGAHPAVIQRHLGHSSITVTMNVYGHLFPSDQEDLAARLDARFRRSLDGHVDRMWTPSA
jgi:integrase